MTPNPHTVHELVMCMTESVDEVPASANELVTAALRFGWLMSEGALRNAPDPFATRKLIVSTLQSMLLQFVENEPIDGGLTPAQRRES